VNKIKALFDEAYESVDDNLNLDIISPSYVESLLSLLDETSNRMIGKFRERNSESTKGITHTLIKKIHFSELYTLELHKQNNKDYHK